MAEQVDYTRYVPGQFFNIDAANPEEIKKFQRDKGIAVDGVVGRGTTLQAAKHNASYPKAQAPPPKSEAELTAERTDRFLRTKQKMDERAQQSPLVSWGVPALGFALGGLGAHHMAKRATDLARDRGDEVTAIGSDIINRGVLGKPVEVSDVGNRAGTVTGAYDKLGKPDPFRGYDGKGTPARGSMTNETWGQFFDRSVSPTALKVGAAGGIAAGTEIMRQRKTEEASKAFADYQNAGNEEEKLLHYERYVRANEAAKFYETMQKGEIAAIGGFAMGRASFPRGKPQDFVKGPPLAAIRSEQRAVQDFYDKYTQKYGARGATAGALPAPGAGARPQPLQGGPIPPAQAQLPAAPAPNLPPQQPQMPPARSYGPADSRIVRDMLGEAAEQGGDPRAITTGQISDRLRMTRGKAPPSTAEIDARKAATDDFLTDNPGTSGDDIRNWTTNKQYKGQRMLGVAGAAGAGAAAAAALAPDDAQAVDREVRGRLSMGDDLERLDPTQIARRLSLPEEAVAAHLDGIKGRMGPMQPGQTRADRLRMLGSSDGVEAAEDTSSPTGYRRSNGQFAPSQ